jgi:hypothetical protein
MVFNHEVLFLHLGKTGGTSVSWLLCNTLQPPVFNVVQKGVLKAIESQGYEFLLEGDRHTNLNDAKTLVEKYGMNITDFKLILVLVRNPVDLEFSLYRHSRKQEVIKRGNTSVDNKLKKRIADARGSFEDFALTDNAHYKGRLRDFFTTENKIPEILKIVRMEEMHEVLPDLLRPFQKHYEPLPHRNKSDEIISNRLSQKALLNIYRKYRWIYDQGFYDLPFDKPINIKSRILKFFGGK